MKNTRFLFASLVVVLSMIISGCNPDEPSDKPDDGSALSLYNPPVTYVDTISYLYTYADLIEALKTCETPLEWKNRIYSLYPGRASLTQLENAFIFWFDL